MEKLMAGMPIDRCTSDFPAFTNVGNNYFEPFEIPPMRKIVRRHV